MTLRIFALSAISAIAALAGSDADAAITVFGPGPAQLCYQGADDGGDAMFYITYCDEALAGVLTTRDRAATFINRGVLKLSLSHSADALTDFNSGLGIDPDLAEGYVDRGASLIAQKQFTAAIRDIDKGLSLGAKKPQIAYYDRAMADEAVGDIPGAYKDYQQSLAAQPDFAPATKQLKRFKVVQKTDGT